MLHFLKKGQNSGNTSDATATASDILSPKTAYAKGSKITGTMIPTYEENSLTLNLEEINTSLTTYLLAANRDYNLAFCKDTYNSNVMNIFNFENNTIGELLDSYAISNTTIMSISCSKALNDNGNLNIFIVERGGTNFNAGFITAMEFNVSSKQILTDTITTQTVWNTDTWWHFGIVNPVDSNKIAVMSSSNKAYNMRICSYENGTISMGANVKVGDNYQDRAAEWNKEGTHIMIRRRLDRNDTTYRLYEINDLTINELVYYSFTSNGNGCIWSGARWFMKNRLLEKQDSETITLCSYNNLDITDADICYTIENMLIVIKNFSTSPELYAYQINPDTYVLTTLLYGIPISYSVGMALTNADYNNLLGSPYCPMSNTSNYLYTLDTGKGYYLDIKTETVISNIIRNNINYAKTNKADAVAKNVLKNKTFFSEGDRDIRVGTMPDNGELILNPGNEEIPIPLGYTSGGKVNAIDITTLIDYNNCLDISNQILNSSDYTYLEYIQSTNGQYIDIGIDCTNIIKLEYKFIPTNNPGYWTSLLSGYIDNFTLGFKEHDLNLAYLRVVGIEISQNISMNISNINTLLLDNSTIKFNGNIIYNRATLGAIATKNGNLCISRNSGSDADIRYTGQKIYSLKVYDINNILVRNMIPAKRHSDNAIGMYDRINSEFYSNNGSGEFIAGPEIM